MLQPGGTSVRSSPAPRRPPGPRPPARRAPHATAPPSVGAGRRKPPRARGRRLAVGGDDGRGDAGRRGVGREPEADELDRHPGQRMRVEPQILGMERLRPVAASGRRVTDHVDDELLPAVAHVGTGDGADLFLGHGVVFEQHAVGRLESPEGFGDVRRPQRLEVGLERRDGVVAHGRVQHPPRREATGRLRDHHLPDPQLRGDLGGMHRPRAAERQQRELPWVESPAHGQGAHGVGHARVGNRDDTLRHRIDAQPERPGDGGDRRPSRLRIEGHAPFQERVGVDPAEHDVGIRHRRLRAAEAIAGWAGRRPRTLWTDPQPAVGHAGERAAAGADRRQADHRQQHRQLIERHLARALGRAVADQAGVERCPAHVQGDQPGPAEHGSQPLGADDAPGGSAEQRQHGLIDDQRCRRRATVGAHHLQPAGEPRVLGAALEAAQIPLHRLGDVRIHHRGRRALVLPDLRCHLVGERDTHAGRTFLQQPPDTALVHAVSVRVDQTDGHGLDSLLLDPLDDVVESRLLERNLDTAVGADPLADRAHVGRRHQRLRPPVVELPDVGALRAAEVQHVAEALGDHQQHPGAAA